MPCTALCGNPIASISARGNPSSTTLVSCRHSTSGCCCSTKRRMLSRRSRTELTFQLVTLSRIATASFDGPLRSADRDLERVDAFDEALEHVALDHRADALGRAAVDQVAGAQLDQAGEVVDGLRDIPDQIGDVALLALLAVDLQPDRALVDDAGLRDRVDRRARRRVIKTLAHVPRPALVARLALDVAARHVEP